MAGFVPPTSDNAFWASPTTEPKRAYRFLLVINGIEHWAVKKVKRPAFKVGEIAHDYINHKFWYPGKVEWDPVTVTLVDPITFDTTGALFAMLVASGYRLPLKSDATRTINKAEAVGAVGSVSILGLGGHPDAPNAPNVKKIPNSEAGFVEKWELVNPWLTTVDMGEYAYDSDAILELGLTFRYDFAKYNLMTGNQEGDAAIWNNRAATKSTQQSTGTVVSQAKTLIAGT